MKKPSRPLAVVLLLCGLAFPRLVQAATIYVNGAAAGANNGTSWANAYTSLASALAAAVPGDEIWVAQGVYKPSVLVDVNAAGGAEVREATFQLKNGVALYGGFAGGEATRDERNWQTNLTILSGDIDNNDVNIDANGIAETTADIVGNNAYHVVYTSNVNAATRLDGFIVTAGKAQHAGDEFDANQDGGAWYNFLGAPSNSSSPSIANCTFRGNLAKHEGGALFNLNVAGGTVASVVEQSKFIANRADRAAGALKVGSFSGGNYTMHITNCEFTQNQAFQYGGAIYALGDDLAVTSTTFTGNFVTVVVDGETRPGSGGAVALHTSSAVFTACMFTGNHATGNDTGYYEGGGGGAVNMQANESGTTNVGPSEPRFVSCGFYNNTVGGNGHAWGGAVNHLSDQGILRPRYVNCVFAGNTAVDFGGAVSNFVRTMGQPAISLEPSFTNCTFTGNHADIAGGAFHGNGFDFNGGDLQNARIENSIFYNNTAPTGQQILNNGQATIAFTLIQGSGGSGGGWDTDLGTDGGGNLDGNPGFTNAASPLGGDGIPATDDDGLTLVPASIAADKGNNVAPGLAGITEDYRSQARLQGSKVDMGAYERVGIAIPDLDIYWLYEWKPKPPVCLSCPWAILIVNNLPQEYVWDGPAQFIDNGATATVVGHIVNRANKTMGFDVYLELVNERNWTAWSALGRGYNYLTLEAYLTAKQSHTRWYFYELSDNSYLKGTGSVSGKLLLKHFPKNKKLGYQFGVGANAYDKDLGLSGAFSFEGTLSTLGKRFRVDGLGSLNVDAERCKGECAPLKATTRETLADLTAADTDTRAFSVYPVPARDRLTVEAATLANGKYSVALYSDKGQLKKQAQLDTGDGDLQLSLQGLEPGLYVLTLTSPTGNTQYKKITIE